MSCHICAYLYYILHIKHFACQTFYHITCNTFYMTVLEHQNMPSVLHHLRHVCLSFTLQNNNENSEKQWFSNQVAVRGTDVSSVALKSVHFQHFIAVILHPKSNAIDSASISFRQEQGLMLRKEQDFPEPLHSGWGSFLRRLTTIHPKRIFMSSKT